jgi:putative oxidoreductase
MTFQILHWTCRLTLAGIFFYTGHIKIQSPLQFAATLSGYKIFSTSIIMPLADYFPWVEITLGILLIIGWKIRYVALGACCLLASFSILLAVTYFRGIEANCGCFSFNDSITPLTIVRDGLILLPAIYLAAESVLRARWGLSVAQDGETQQSPSLAE